MKKILTAFFLLFFTAVLSYATVSISPSRVEMHIDKNDVFVSSYSVTNNYDGDIDVEIMVEDGNSYRGNGDLNINSWLKIAPGRLHLKAGETKMVQFEVKTTSSMQGAVIAKVSFLHNPPRTGGVTIKMSFFIYAIIRGTENVDFYINDILFYKQGDNGAVANINVDNVGNIYIRPSGTINIYKGKKLLSSEGISSPIPIFPTASDAVKSNPFSIEGLKPGKYIAEIIINAYGKSVSKKIEFRIKKDRSLIQ